MTNSTIDLPSETTLEQKLKDLVDYHPLEKRAHSPLPGKTIGIYDASNIDKLPWPISEEGRFARRYFTPLVKDGIKHYIDNINAEIRLLVVSEHVIPILVVNNDYSNAYVCSPHAHYVSLALDSLHVIKNSWVRRGVQSLLKGFGKLLLKGEINQIVYVNHWLLSTDLYPQNLTPEDIGAITSFLKKEFPRCAIAMRSINQKTNQTLHKQLKKCGFNFIASRQVYLTDTGDKSLFSTRIIKSDLRLWKDNDYEVIDDKQLTSNDFTRILKLYNIVSLEHHSHLNPQLNARYIKIMIEQGFLKVKALKLNGNIDGVVGYFEKNNQFMCPFFGYDKSHPDKNRLYRLLSTLLLLEASKKASIFHQSAGASFYKKIRRAVGHQEYMAIYTSHLPPKQRFTWGFLRSIMNSAGTIFMRKY